MKLCNFRLHAWRAVLLLTLVASANQGVLAQDSIFRIQKSPDPSPAADTLNAVTAISATDAWAVGFKNDNNFNNSRTLTAHWDGRQWRTVPSPNPASNPECEGFTTSNFLSSVAAVSSNDVWAVGSGEACSTLQLPLAMHWDGTRWKAVRTPKLFTTENAAFNAVFATASDNVYAVGSQPASNAAILTLIEHWDGKAWHVVPSPNASQTGNILSAISGTSPTDIWAVGTSVAQNSPNKTLVLHFDGANWSVIPSPNPLSGPSDQNVLLSVKALSSNDVTATGLLFDSANRRTLTLVEHWDGNSWTVVPSPNNGEAIGDTNELRAVAVFSSNDAYAVGAFSNSSTGGQPETLVEHFDGTSWSIIPSPTQGLAQRLNGAFALLGTRNLSVVGASSGDGINQNGFLQEPRTLILFSPIG